jgi:magnesium chelatase accessory protein
MTEQRLAWADWRDRWPNANTSRFVDVAGRRWHVQIAGTGPAILLIHGAGGATHSWGDVLPRLAERWTVVAPDLPGHAFSATPADVSRLSLDGIAADLTTLLGDLGITPRVVVGHSAGAAILLRMASLGTITPDAIVGLNAALAAPPAAADSSLLPPLRVLARTAGVARVLSAIARFDGVADSLLQSTGTVLPAAQRERYRALARSAAHVQAVFTMFANWDVSALTRALTRLTIATTFASAPNDPWVPPADTAAVARTMPRARCVALPPAGHLAHEVEPAAAAAVIGDAIARLS